MSRHLVDASARLLSARVSRRSFLARAAVVGSAISVAPMRYILEPDTAYAAICRCSGSDCDCGALCCDGYTDFCCSIYGSNVCPSGTVPAGWWKADGSGFCDVGGQSRPRYYLDCNAVDCGTCSCGSRGTCHHSCDRFTCGCGLGRCDHRKSGCTSFRYGQCNNHIECVGAIVCRVVTCTPPWEWDDNCSRVSATDNATRFHDAPCLRGSTRFDVPIFGDWNGDGVKSPGVFRKGVWYLSNTMASGGPDTIFAFGDAGDVPVVGDWAGSGKDGIGVVRGDRWFLKHRARRGRHDIAFRFGRPGDIPIAGDWDGDGRAGPGVFRSGRWLLKNAKRSGRPDFDFFYGDPGDRPVVGDWKGRGTDYVGVVRSGEWLLRIRNSRGRAHIRYDYGDPGDLAIVGDWDGNGTVTPGVVRNGRWYLRNANSSGKAHRVIDFDTTAPPAEEAAAAVAAGRE